MIESGAANGINFTYIKNILKLFPMFKPLQNTEKRKKNPSSSTVFDWERD